MEADSVLIILSAYLLCYLLLFIGLRHSLTVDVRIVLDTLLACLKSSAAFSFPRCATLLCSVPVPIEIYPVALFTGIFSDHKFTHILIYLFIYISAE